MTSPGKREFCQKTALGLELLHCPFPEFPVCWLTLQIQGLPDFYIYTYILLVLFLWRMLINTTKVENLMIHILFCQTLEWEAIAEK